MENLIKQIKESQEKLKSIVRERESFTEEIKSLKGKIANSREIEKKEREYLSKLARQYSAEVSTDFPDQTIGWHNPSPRMRSKIYGHGAASSTQASHDIEETHLYGASN
jgi:septal ring factor EnvC (AmiA/AmiB activator)